MADSRLSRKADDDLTEIYLYPYRHFGASKADAYLSALEECFELISRQPSVSVDVARLRAGYRRYIHERHAVYYKVDDAGVLIVRVPGPGMAAETHL